MWVQKGFTLLKQKERRWFFNAYSRPLQLSPSVGEVVKFVNTHGEEQVTTFQINKVLSDLFDSGYVTKKAERHGKRVWTRWSINPSGALSLMPRIKFLPKHIRDFMDALNSRVAAASNVIIQEYFEQGAQ